MGWEDELFALFDDLEEQASALHAAERTAEIADRSRAEYQQVTLASRMMASVGTTVALGIGGVGVVPGTVERVAEGWLLLSSGEHDWVVSTSAIRSVEGASVRVNVSSGPKPVAVPAVIGQTYETAAAQLQAAGFTVGRVAVESDRPAGEVVDQEPPGNSTASRGSSVTLSVSQGPKTVTVPDVSLQSVADARATLRAAGFKSSVTEQETDDEALDGLVISQDPAGNAQADPKSTVKLTVGAYTPPPDVTK